MSLKHAVERLYGEVSIDSGPLSNKLTAYADLLAAQGALSAALTYLGKKNLANKTNPRFFVVPGEPKMLKRMVSEAFWKPDGRLICLTSKGKVNGT